MAVRNNVVKKTAQSVKTPAKKVKGGKTPFEEELDDVIKKITEFKVNAETNCIGIIYNDPEVLYDTELSVEDFSENCWRVYFEIAKGIFIGEGKEHLDDVTVGLYLEKHDSLRKMYDEYGGWGTVANKGNLVHSANFDGYEREIRKWQAVINLAKRGFPVKSRLSDYKDMSAEEIYDENQVYLNNIFLNIDEDVMSYDVSEGIYGLIDRLNEGESVGLEYYNMPLLNSTVSGMLPGNITLIAGLSNVGKSSFVRNAVLPSIIENDGERVVFMVNEEGLDRVQRELLVTICNIKLKYDIQKHVVRNGSYTDDVKEKLKEAADWLKEHTANHKITVVVFKHYNTKKAIKVLRKYARMGVQNFILDTFKLDANAKVDNSWLSLQQASVELYDTIKPDALNVHLIITFQLSKGAAKQRYFTIDSLGISKNVLDVCSTAILIRNLFEDELGGGKKALKVWRPTGKDGSQIIQELDKHKHYQALFIAKNREGAANDKQIVLESDLSRNMVKEIGYCSILPDTF